MSSTSSADGKHSNTASMDTCASELCPVICLSSSSSNFSEDSRDDQMFETNSQHVDHDDFNMEMETSESGSASQYNLFPSSNVSLND